MIRFLVGLISLCLSISVIAQDAYHTELLTSLQTDYGLENASFVINDNEVSNVNQIAVYGNVTQQTTNVTNANYTILQRLRVNSAQNDAWDAGYTIRNRRTVQSGDVLLFTFVARRLSDEAEMFLFAEDASTFEKETYTMVNLDPDWNTYYLPVRCGSNHASNRLSLGFHIGSMAQEFEIAGFTVLNYGDSYELEDFPSSFGIGGYEGSAPDAEWRARAADRIETIRKADMDITVVDAQGSPVPGATVSVAMKEHDFGFGSAFVTCRMPGNNCFNQTYVTKIFNLDGNGNGFNVGVTENALKWDGWEEEWIGSPAETVDAVTYLDEQGIEIRGHTLIWPGYSNMPDDIFDNRNNADYVRERVYDRISEMVEHPVLGDMVTDWDILNEITQNRDLEQVFSTEPGYETGREFYLDIINQVKEKNSETSIWINDYVLFSGGGSSSSVVDRYKTYLDELLAADVPWDGIGFQGHIGAQPTSLVKIENTLDEFYERYGKRAKITEYDISPNASEEIQAAYLADFLTMIYSHPSMDAFIMWGFWDGNHWKDNSPMFDLNWNLKPSGQAFIDKVFGEWWTEEVSQTGSDGSSTIRGYKGTYDVQITAPSGEIIDTTLVLSDDLSTTIMTSGLVATETLSDLYSIYPNPARDIIYINTKSTEECTVTLTGVDGKTLHTGVYSAETIEIPVSVNTNTILLVQIQTGSNTHIEKVLVQGQ